MSDEIRNSVWDALPQLTSELLPHIGIWKLGNCGPTYELSDFTSISSYPRMSWPISSVTFTLIRVRASLVLTKDVITT
jgi:hypothetical protein